MIFFDANITLLVQKKNYFSSKCLYIEKRNTNLPFPVFLANITPKIACF